jgi:integrase
LTVQGYHNVLSDTKIRAAKATEKPVKLFDGGGLYVLVNPPSDRLPGGSKLFRFKYYFGRNRKGTGAAEKVLALGQYPYVSLKDARDRRDDALKLLHAEPPIDPAANRKAAKRATANTFQLIAEAYVENRMERAMPPRSPRTVQKARTQLRTFIYPRLGQRPIHEITLKDIREALQAITVGGKRIETAYKTKELLGRIFKYAKNQFDELPIHNIVADIETKEILGKRPDNNLAAIMERPKIGELLRAMEGYSGQPATLAALRLLPHVFLRSSEIRGGRWTEIDFKASLWRVPASRMKSKVEHIVPLSKQATEILKELKKITGKGDHMFPAIGPKRRPISENTLGGALAALGYDSDSQTPHGFRAIWRTVAAEDLEIRIDWLELQLAHEVKDSNGRAYNRASFLPQRAKAMQQWSDYLDKLRDAT